MLGYKVTVINSFSIYDWYTGKFAYSLRWLNLIGIFHWKCVYKYLLIKMRMQTMELIDVMFYATQFLYWVWVQDRFVDRKNMLIMRIKYVLIGCFLFYTCELWIYWWDYRSAIIYFLIKTDFNVEILLINERTTPLDPQKKKKSKK